MKKLISIFCIFIITSCGGAGAPSLGVLEIENTTPPPPTTSSTSWVFGKVIDGYIEGANVYIDFNWNLQQDEGEPSAVSDGEGNYTFTASDFDAITNVSYECAFKRVMVVDVPVGAYDVNRGYVDEAFVMYNIPFEESSTRMITPFTGLFLNIVNEVKQATNYTPVPVSEGCGAEANSIGTSVVNEMISVSDMLWDQHTLTFHDLYSDFIANENNEWTIKAEQVVDFLKGSKTLRDNVNQSLSDLVGESIPSSLYVSQSSLDLIFNDVELNSLPFSLNAHFTGEDNYGWSNFLWLSSSDVSLNQDGTLNNGLSPTFNNMKEHAAYYNMTLGSYNTIENSEYLIRKLIRNERKDSLCNNHTSLNYEKQGIQYSISHHLNLEYELYCTQEDLPELISIEYQEYNSDNTNHYSMTLHVEPNVSSIFPNVPVSFDDLNYNTLLYDIQSKIVDYNALESLQLSLINSESVSISRSKYYSDINGQSFSYIVYADSVQCLEFSWDGNVWSLINQTEGSEAYNACYNFILEQ